MCFIVMLVSGLQLNSELKVLIESITKDIVKSRRKEVKVKNGKLKVTKSQAYTIPIYSHR